MKDMPGHGIDNPEQLKTMATKDSGRDFKKVPTDGTSLDGVGNGTPIPNRTKGPSAPSHGGTTSAGPTNWQKGGMAPKGVQTIPNKT